MESGDREIPEAIKYALVSYAYTRLKFEDEQRFIEEMSGGDEKQRALWKSMFEDGYFSLTLGGHFLGKLEAADESRVGKYISKIIENKPYIDIIRDIPDEEIRAVCAMTEANIEEDRSMLDRMIPIGPAKFVEDRSELGMEPVVIKPYLSRVRLLFHDIYQLKVTRREAALMDRRANAQLELARRSDDVEESKRAADYSFAAMLHRLHGSIDIFYRRVSPFVADEYMPDIEVIGRMVQKIQNSLPGDEAHDALEASERYLEDLSRRLE